MATFISHNPTETQALGEEWGRLAQRGWVIGLSGDLGAGKTQLVKGLARGMNITGRIQSPTFPLINEHCGERLQLFHIDLYRLETREQIIAAGLEPYLIRPNGVTVVEWIERWIGDQPPAAANFKFRRVHIQTLGETDRQIDYEDIGS